MQFGNNQLKRLYLKCAHDQVHVDAIYEEFVDNVHNEMKAFLKKLDRTERPDKKSYKKLKSY